MKNGTLVTITLLGVLVIFGLGTATGHTIEKNRVEERVAAAKSASHELPREQTWPLAYRDTTCGAWLDRMTPDERYVAAADLLGGFTWDSPSKVHPTVARNLIGAMNEACDKEISQNVVRVATDIFQAHPGQYTT